MGRKDGAKRFGAATAANDKHCSETKLAGEGQPTPPVSSAGKGTPGKDSEKHEGIVDSIFVIFVPFVVTPPRQASSSGTMSSHPVDAHTP